MAGSMTGPWPKKWYCMGLDLGQSVDPSAICIIEALIEPKGDDWTTMHPVETKQRHVVDWLQALSHRHALPPANPLLQTTQNQGYIATPDDQEQRPSLVAGIPEHPRYGSERYKYLIIGHKALRAREST